VLKHPLQVPTMMRLNLPATPLANAMHMWTPDLIAKSAHSAGASRVYQPMAAQKSSQLAHVTPGKVTAAATLVKTPAQMPQGLVEPPTMSIANSCLRTKRELGTPYRSVDPTSGRVWGVPNAGGRGQCFDCPGRAMTGNKRCESCLRALAQAVHEKMSSDDLRRLQCSFDAALGRLSGSKHKDTSERLQQLYCQLQAGKITPAIQSQLLAIASAIASCDSAVASKRVATLSNQYWEEHKDWLTGMKRLLSTQ